MGLRSGIEEWDRGVFVGKGLAAGGRDVGLGYRT